MKRSRTSRTRSVVPLGLMLFLALGACGDSTGPRDEPFGTWVLEDAEGDIFLEVNETAITRYRQQGSCFIQDDFTVSSISGNQWTLQDESGATVVWTVSRDDGDLVVDTDVAAAATFSTSTTDLQTLVTCVENEDAYFPYAACEELPEVAVNGSVNGTLALGDARYVDGTWFDLYALHITSETAVNITLSSTELDTYLELYEEEGTPGGFLRGVDDIDANDTDSRIQRTLAPGCYIIFANSYSGDDAGETGGDYTLSVSTTLVQEFPAEACTSLPAVAVGGSVSGTLQTGDARWRDDTWYDLYSLQLAEQRTVEITMQENGSGIDTYLMLYDELATERLEEDDDIDATNFNSRITTTLDPGCYIIVANSYEGDDAGETGGAYTLTVAQP